MRFFSTSFAARRSSQSSQSSQLSTHRSTLLAAISLLALIIHHPTTTTAWTTTTSSTTNNSRSFGSSYSKQQQQQLSMANTESSATSSTTSETDMTSSAVVSFRQSVQRRLVNSWVAQLNPETAENFAKSMKQSGTRSNDTFNKTKRPVFNGHYVPVRPSGLSQPRLVLYSKDVAFNVLGFTPAQIESNDFTEFVAGNLHLSETSWATPYALSIMGTRYTSNCPYGTGDGYGDGRAISIGEILSSAADNNNNNNNSSYELQLKGAGTTPFHRGADGRAVLRSSIREFLASEAMHFLGVATTRALSLVVSGKDVCHRPWYNEAAANDDTGVFGGAAPRRRRPASNIPSLDDPRLANYDEAQRRQIIQQLKRQKSDPDVMVEEPAAITCRVATSFTRIGHLDLFARRAQAASMVAAQATDSNYCTESLAWKELEQLVWHACYREYRDTAYTPFIDTADIAKASTILLQESAEKLATMVAHWIRVGFAQGNFNADNCLVGGKTMDYGPFGWMEEYDPLFAKWTGSGQHFGFMNQPAAAFANYGVLVESVAPVIAAARGLDDHDTIQQEFLEQATVVFQTKMDEVMRVKLGFDENQDVADELWATLEPLLSSSRVDWTLFFRELTYLVRDVPELLNLTDGTEFSYDDLLTKLVGDDKERAGSSPFYETLTPALRAQWLTWIESWRDALAACSDNNKEAVVERMRQANPKYVLREWMLVEAYQSAAKGEEARLFALHDLIQRPYDEGSASEIQRYYRRAPEEALTAGGTAFMS